MKILIYSYNYYPEPIGIAPLMTELAEGLVKRGHKVRVVTAMPNYPERKIYENYRGKLFHTEYKNDVQIQRSYIWVRANPNLIERLLLDASFVISSFIPALMGWRPDVILATSPSLPGCVTSTLLGWFYRCPIVLNLQDILPEAAVKVGLLKNPFWIKLLSGLEKFAYKNATKISVIADGFIENLQEKGVDENKIVHIPNWVDTNFIQPLPKTENYFRQAHNLHGKFIILYSGNIALTQGLETVVKGAAMLGNIANIAFVIVGQEKKLQKLGDECQKCGADNVLLVPFQPRERLPEMLAAADLSLVIQKKNIIGFNMPSKIQVLMATGRAIVASVPGNGTAARTLKKSGGAAVIPPENPQALAQAILELYKNPAKVKNMGYNNRQYAVKHYSIEQALNNYESLLETTLGERSVIDSAIVSKQEV